MNTDQLSGVLFAVLVSTVASVVQFVLATLLERSRHKREMEKEIYRLDRAEEDAARKKISDLVGSHQPSPADMKMMKRVVRERQANLERILSAYPWLTEVYAHTDIKERLDFFEKINDFEAVLGIAKEYEIKAEEALSDVKRVEEEEFWKADREEWEFHTSEPYPGLTDEEREEEKEFVRGKEFMKRAREKHDGSSAKSEDKPDQEP